MIRAQCQRLVAHPLFDKIIIALIAINAVTLGLETSQTIMGAVGPVLLTFDKVILGIFVFEIIVRLIADFRGFWRDPWRIFDFAIVLVALLPSSGPLSVLRAFRILRILRLVSSVPSMRRVVTGLLEALPGMGTIVMLLALIFYVFAVISTKLFAESFPEWFGTIGESSYTLFQIMTLESWSMGIVRPVMEAYPLAWLLFIPFILATAFTVLNLFIGVIVDAMQSEHASDAHDEREAMMAQTKDILVELKALRAEVAALKTKE
ncbi:MAG: ion transporter [Pseudomonadota bacterium]